MRRVRSAATRRRLADASGSLGACSNDHAAPSQVETAALSAARRAGHVMDVDRERRSGHRNRRACAEPCPDLHPRERAQVEMTCHERCARACPSTRVEWSRGESNPRPVQSNCRLYVCSRLFDLDPRTAIGSLPLDHFAIVSRPCEFAMDSPGQPAVCRSAPPAGKRDGSCRLVKQQERTACWQLWFCTFVNAVHVRRDTPRQPQPVRSKPVGPSCQ